MGATASIEPKVGSYVWGCVWRVPHSFAEELDLQESGYHRLTGIFNLGEENSLCFF